MDNISSVAAADLQIDKSGPEKVLSVEYTARVPLFQHVFLMIEFSASSRPAAGKH